MNKFIIGQKLPSLNEYVAACRSNPYAGAQFKSEIEEMIGWEIRSAANRGMLYNPGKPVIVKFTWHEKTKRRDYDNIVSAHKFILDALVKNKILTDDGRRYVKGGQDIIIDDKIDYVEVELIETE